MFASSLLAIYYVEVEEEFRGRKLSHDLVGKLSRIFVNDAIALEPASASLAPNGEYVLDEIKHRALTKHWAAMGFVPIGNERIMLLPMSADCRQGATG